MHPRAVDIGLLNHSPGLTSPLKMRKIQGSAARYNQDYFMPYGAKANNSALSFRGQNTSTNVSFMKTMKPSKGNDSALRSNLGNFNKYNQ